MPINSDYIICFITFFHTFHLHIISRQQSLCSHLILPERSPVLHLMHFHCCSILSPPLCWMTPIFYLSNYVFHHSSLQTAIAFNMAKALQFPRFHIIFEPGSQCSDLAKYQYSLLPIHTLNLNILLFCVKTITVLN